jgi:hypothetical protein
LASSTRTCSFSAIAVAGLHLRQLLLQDRQSCGARLGGARVRPAGHRAAAGRGRLIDLGQGLGEELPALVGAAQGLVRALELLLKAVEGAEVGLALLRQLPHVALFELRDLALLVLQAAADVRELGLQELGRGDRVLLAVADVLVHVQRGELVGHGHGRVRVRGRVGHAEGHRPRVAPVAVVALEVDPDVPAHAVHGLVR